MTTKEQFENELAELADDAQRLRYRDNPKDDESVVAERVAIINSYVSQLEAQVPKWVSTEERLPENYVTVLILLRYTAVEIAEFDPFKDLYPWRPYSDHPTGYAESEVTHWMPLPEPPEAK